MSAAVDCGPLLVNSIQFSRQLRGSKVQAAIVASLMDELALSERLIRGGSDVLPRFRIFAPEGQYVVFMPPPEGSDEAARRMILMSEFMAWKMAIGFVFSAELKDPRAIASYCVMRAITLGFMRRVSWRAGLAFGATEALDPERFATKLLALLPPRQTTLTFSDCDELARVFDEDEGELPARRVR